MKKHTLIGTRWRRPDDANQLGPVRVMAVADNWAMVRFPGCIPFTVFVRDLAAKWEAVAG